MNKLKHCFKSKRLSTILGIVIAFIVIYLLLILTIKTFDYADKHRCSNMPFEELKEDSSCDEYWRDINDG